MSKVILISGLAKSLPEVIDGDLIGVDHGASIIAKAKKRMVLAIGDFDSVTLKEFEEIKKYADEVVKLQVEKDETDTEEAIQYALEDGYTDIEVYGALGGRIDHEMANMYLLMYRRYPFTLVSDKNRVSILSEGSYKIKSNYKYLSFLALEESCITERGVAYPLEHETLTLKDIYSISNEIIADECEVIVHYGRVLMMETSD